MFLAPRQYFGYHKPKKGAGTWRARLYLPEKGLKKKTTIGTADDFADPNGTTILDFGQAQAKAQKWLQDCEMEALKVDRDDGPKKGYTVKEAVQDYLTQGRRDGLRGMDISEQVAKARIYPALGDIQVGKLTRKRLEDWAQALAESPKLRTGRGTSIQVEDWEKPPTPDQLRARKNTANRILSILRRALNLAHERNRVTGGTPWRDVALFKKVQKARTRFLNRDEQIRLVNACPPDFKRLVQGALLSGARYGELTRVKVCDFHEAAGTLYVPAHVAKSGKERHIVLTEEGKAFFAALCAGRNATEIMFQRTMVKRLKRKGDDLSWASSDQTPFIARACKAALLEALTFHELRHTYASTLVNLGVPLAYVAAQLGHADTRMVEKYYGHLAPSDLAKSIRKLVPTLGITEESKIKSLKIKKSS